MFSKLACRIFMSVSVRMRHQQGRAGEGESQTSKRYRVPFIFKTEVIKITIEQKKEYVSHKEEETESYYYEKRIMGCCYPGGDGKRPLTHGKQKKRYPPPSLYYRPNLI